VPYTKKNPEVCNLSLNERSNQSDFSQSQEMNKRSMKQKKGRIKKMNGPLEGIGLSIDSMNL